MRTMKHRATLHLMLVENGKVQVMRFALVSKVRMTQHILVTVLFAMPIILGLTVSAKPASYTKFSITGEWAGTVKCSRNRGLNINLHITSRSAGLTATMETHGAKRLLGKVWTHKLVGRYEAESGSYLFVPARHSRGPRGISKGFRFIPSGNGKRAEGSVPIFFCKADNR